MTFRLGLAQRGYPTDGTVIAQVEAFAAQAKRRDVDLLAFPEDLMCPGIVSAEQLRDISEPLDGHFSQAVAAIARDTDLWLVFTMSERNPAGGAPFNTAVVMSDQGQICGVYRKCHLYDAHRIRESDRISAGSSLCEPVATPFCTLGLGICYDLRFPELARNAALAGCDLLLYPSAWHAGPQKLEHWRGLLAARAIENECFVAGVCHAGRRYVGHSMVVDPLGCVLAEGPDGADPTQGETLVVADIDTSAISSARAAMPVLEHRRPELY